jgi:hypothetical protein
MSNRVSSSPDASSKIIEVSDADPSITDPLENGIVLVQEEPNPQHSSDDAIFPMDEEIEEKYKPERTQKKATQLGEDVLANGTGTAGKTRTIEITLRADSEFFHLLTNELSSIDNVQAQQKARLTSEVSDLGNKVVAVTRPSGSKSASDLYAWRELLALYKDASVFFASTERDHGAHTAEQARERMQWFASQIEKSQLVSALPSKVNIQISKFKHKQSKDLLNRFLRINKTLIQSMLFQEINTTATQKILKKFDKRTALTYQHHYYR